MIKKISSVIFKTFLLSLMVIADLHFAFAQSTQQGIIPNGKATFLDQNGKPVTAGTVDFYIPGTTTRKTTYQDINGTTPNTNPVILDAAGRALLWGTGSYRQVVKDKTGNLIWDVTTSSAGSSSGGGGGGTATGDGDLVGTIKPWAGMTAPNQYLFTYGQELVRTTYPALFTAITSAQGVFCTSASPILTGLGDTTNFWIGMKVELNCVSGGSTTIISKTSTTVTLALSSNVTTNTNATFFSWGNGNGTTTFNLPDFRGVVPMGNNIMGGVASANSSTTYFGATNPNSSGALGGNQSVTLGLTNLPTGITSSNASQGISVNSTVADILRSQFGATSSTATTGGALGQLASSSGNQIQTITSTGNNSISVTSNNTGSSGVAVPFSLIQPSRTVNFIIKVTPDANSATANGVTDINGMTGSIACAGNIICSGNIITVPLGNVSSIGGMTGAIACGDSITCATNTISSSYTSSLTGGVTRLTSSKLADWIDAADFGVKCDNSTNDAINLQNAINATPIGGTLRISYRNSGKCLTNATLNLPNPIHLICDANVSIKPITGIGSGAVLNFIGSPNGLAFPTFIDDCFIGDSGAATRLGGVGIFFDTTTLGNYFRGLEIRNVTVKAGTTGAFGILFLNNTTNNPNGGVFVSTIRGGVIEGGINFNGSGDNLAIRDTLVPWNGAPGADNNGILVNLVNSVAGAAGSFLIDHINFSQPGGVIFDNVYSGIVQNSQFEGQVTSTEPNNAIVDVRAGAGTIQGFKFRNNQIQALPSIGSPLLLRISSNVVHITVDGNAFSTPTGYTGVSNASTSLQLGPNFWLTSPTHISGTAPANIYGGG